MDTQASSITGELAQSAVMSVQDYQSVVGGDMMKMQTEVVLMHIKADSVASTSNRPDTLAANVEAWQAMLPNLPREELLRKLGASGSMIARNPHNAKVRMMETAALLDIAEQVSAQCMPHTLAYRGRFQRLHPFAAREELSKTSTG